MSDNNIIIDDSGLVWEEPAPMTSSAFDFTPYHEALKQRPGQWAKIKEYKSKNGAQDKAGALRKAYPDCEFTTRIDRANDSRWLYGRVLPETEVVAVVSQEVS